FDKEKIAPIVEQFLAPIPLSRLAFAKEKYEMFLASHQHQAIQFIVLGAGLDSFSLTNDNPQVEVYEFDHPNSFRYKLARIESLNLVMPKNLHFVPIDFEKQSLSTLLKESPIKPTVPTFITFLGVAYYLELNTLKDTLATLSSFFKGELTLVFDYPDNTTKTSPTNSRVTKLANLTSLLGEHMVDGFSYSQIQTLLLNTHFNLDEHLAPHDIDERYFKENSSLKAYENVHFISATL
ncbi:MAG: class I SAM-dependent methyltransferase, partial [Succinivibrio sp.]|nr:class I SAM-dependent methyltransferase [Succinivibrio sp.]